MSQVDEEMELSETAEEQDCADNARLVPVAESIRYRRRAQSAERKAEQLGEQLAEAKSEAERVGEQLRQVQREQELTRKLASEQTSDMETALLVVRARLQGEKQADLQGVIEQLKKDKPYLFGGGGEAAVVAKTSGVKERVGASRTVLASAAKKAAVTGSRADVQEYLRKRRNFTSV